MGFIVAELLATFRDFYKEQRNIFWHKREIKDDKIEPLILEEDPPALYPLDFNQRLGCLSLLSCHFRFKKLILAGQSYD